MITIEFPKLENWQRDLFEYYLKHPKGKWIITKAIRQVGKSILAQILLVYASMSKDYSVSYSISPVMSQSRKIFEDISRWAAPIIKKSNGSLLTITFINGSVIKLKSAEQADNIRGETCKGNGILIVDEAAYMKSDFFYSVLVPITNVSNSDIIIFSTPKFKREFYYDLYISGLSDIGKTHSFDWTKYDTSKYLTPENLEMYRKQMPKTAFRSEFLGEFIDGDGCVFSDFKRCVGDFELSPLKELYLTIDWACGNGGNSDSTVITIGQKYEGKVGIKQQIAFNDKKPLDTCKYIVDLIKDYVNKGYRWITIIQEKNSIGNVYYSMLLNMIDEYEQTYNDNASWKHQIEINLHTFLTTNDSKKRIIERLETLFEQGLIIIPNDENLLTQLAMFEAKVNSNGTVLYGVQMSAHDDMVLSLCFLVDKLWNELSEEDVLLQEEKYNYIGK